MVERSDFRIVACGEFNKFTLFSVKYDREFSMTISFIGVDKPTQGDVLELPDGMLRVDCDRSLFSNKQLCFGAPNAKLTIPEGFDIEEDYAYLRSGDHKRVLLQRYYG